MKTVAAGVLAAALLVAPATAHADDPVPTADEVVGIMQQLTDPNISAANKGNIVTPGFSPDEAGTIDNHLDRMNRGALLPLPFIVTEIQPAPDNLAGATIAIGGTFHQWSHPGPIVLEDQGGHWMLTHHSAMSALDAYWYNANRHPIVTGAI
jgi:hypothetical protein